MDEETLIKAVVEALTFESDEEYAGFTSLELSTKLGWSRERVLNALRILSRQGKLGRFKKPTEKIDGTINWTPAYYLKSDNDGVGI